MKYLFTITTMVMSMMYAQCGMAQLRITNTTDYRTMPQLFLANEINESGEPFAESLGYDLDELDPMVANMPDSTSYTLGIENYEYSRYQLGTIVSRSGMGLHIMWGPAIRQMAAAQDSTFDGSITGKPNGFNEDDVLMKTIRSFGMHAHMKPFANAWPQFAEFISGDPHLPQKVAPDFATNFKTLRWDRSKMVKVLNPGALGQSMMKQYLWAQDMLSGFHDADEGEVAVQDGNPDHADGTFDPTNNVFYGGDNADGFIGQVLTAEAINKAMFLIGKLAYDGKNFIPVSPAMYNPMNGIRYFPHMIAVEESMVAPMMPPRLSKLTVTDGDSYLWDQLSILWGSVSFANMMNPTDTSDDAHKVYKYVFDGDPFPPAAAISGKPGPYDLMKGLSKVVILNLMAMHRNMTMGSFVDKASLDTNGHVVQGNRISAVNAGYLLMEMSLVANELAGTPLQQAALGAINMQANFVLTKMKDPNGGFANFVTFGVGPDKGAKKAMAQAAIARGLYAAFEATGNQAYFDGAEAAYKYLMTFYRPDLMAFSMKEGVKIAKYNPFNLAILAGGLRAATLTGKHQEAAMIYTRFFKKVINKMQLSEAGATGETGGDSDNDGIPFIPEQPENLPPVLAPQAEWDLTTGTSEVNPDHLKRLSIRPNPVRTSAEIRFNLKESADVSIRLYNATGKQLQAIFDGHLKAGDQSITWRPRVPRSGAYFYQIYVDGAHSQSGMVEVLK